MKNQFRVLSFSFVAVAMIASTPVWADSLTVQSNLSNTEAQVQTGSAVLTSGNVSGLTFTADLVQDYNDGSGSWAWVPNAPTGTKQVTFPNPSNAYNDPSGFVETTFLLPTNFSAATISGLFSVDDDGYAFLNGHEIGYTSGATYAQFATAVQADFVSGTNTLIFSDNNSGGGPSGMEFYGTVNYAAAQNQTSVTPEPSSMLLMGSGLLGFAGMVRRKIAARA